MGKIKTARSCIGHVHVRKPVKRVYTLLTGKLCFDLMSTLHTHAPDTAGAAARSVVSRMVESVNTEHESTRNVIRDAIQGSSEGTLAALPSRRTLSRRIQRARRRLNPTPPIPVQRSGFEIPDKYTKTISDLRFLQYDSGIDDVNRI